MALEVTNLEREFHFKKDGKDIPLKDPNIEISPEEVAKFYAGTHPELTNAIIEGPKVEGDKASYSFTTKAGNSGNYGSTGICKAKKKAKMQKQETSQGNRKGACITRSSSSQPKGRETKNGSNKGRAKNASAGEFGFHILNGLRQIPLFEIAMMRGQAKDEGLIRMINTEARQLQAIEDLYKIVTAQPCYKNLREPDWPAETSPLIVIYWLLRKLGPLAKGDRWSVDTYQDGNRTRYRFIVYRYFHSQKVRRDWEFIPLDFLPALKKRDLPLHELLIDIIALISKRNNVPLWDEDSNFSPELKKLIISPDTGNSVVDLQKLSYSTGPANQYLNLIKRKTKTVTLSSVQSLLNKYDAASERKRVIRYWINNGLELAESGKNLHPFDFVPNYHSGPVISSSMLYKFVWSVHNNDIIASRSVGRMHKLADGGFFIPLMYTSTRPGETLMTITGNDKFPEDLYDFMSTGASIFLGRYRSYFYKQQLESQKTPTETLLEKIEQAEIINNQV